MGMPDSMTVGWDDEHWQTMLNRFQEDLTPEVLEYYMVIKGKKVFLPFTNFDPPGAERGEGAMQLPSKDFLENRQNIAKNTFCGRTGKDCSLLINTGWWVGTRLA